MAELCEDEKHKGALVVSKESQQYSHSQTHGLAQGKLSGIYICNSSH